MELLALPWDVVDLPLSSVQSLLDLIPEALNLDQLVLDRGVGTGAGVLLLQDGLARLFDVVHLSFVGIEFILEDLRKYQYKVSCGQFQAMASVALVLALVPLQKFLIDFKISSGSALLQNENGLQESSSTFSDWGNSNFDPNLFANKKNIVKPD